MSSASCITQIMEETAMEKNYNLLKNTLNLIKSIEVEEESLIEEQLTQIYNNILYILENYNK